MPQRICGVPGDALPRPAALGSALSPVAYDRTTNNFLVAGKYLKKYEERARATRLAQRRCRANLKERIASGAVARVPRRAADGPDQHYGRPDDPVALQTRMEETRQRLQHDLNEREAILSIPQRTREWKEARSLRLTASNFGEVCKRYEYTSCKNLVHRLLYKESREVKKQPPPIQHGIEHEPKAKARLEDLLGVSIEECGLFISAAAPHLGASPGKRQRQCRCKLRD